MSDDSNKHNHPKKPMGRWSSAGFGVISGAAVSSVIDVVWQKLISKRPKLNTEKMLSNAIETGVIVGIIEFFVSGERHRTYNARLHNKELHEKVDRLENQLAQNSSATSHVERLSNESNDKSEEMTR